MPKKRVLYLSYASEDTALARMLIDPLQNLIRDQRFTLLDRAFVKVGDKEEECLNLSHPDRIEKKGMSMLGSGMVMAQRSAYLSQKAQFGRHLSCSRFRQSKLAFLYFRLQTIITVSKVIIC